MIRSADIDAIAVAVRVPARRAFVLVAIAAGKHVHRTVRSGEMRELPVEEQYFDVSALRRAPAVHLVRAYTEFAAAIAGGRAATPGFDEAVRLHRLLDAVETASGEGRRVDLDGPGLPDRKGER